ncbi:hypothetical protein N7462_007846 [Penicillium macrosclerotiorum]|uniref:uncharacterized protein n=1 Tax=Penicillium macrosclerotiorum TaxID=303699 RepID=UPI0025472096|nr:uncharacterized protein N7462_007846 [Penicillium macrosclerotiorum]KAJ5679602.1 hypothetical protein N7462_007846 [Penicillium macrosclerotiorum]
MINFLHQRYFPRLAWAKLTLNPRKTAFFVDRTKILGHECSITGIRPSADKIAAIANWTRPVNEPELMRFIYVLPFLRTYIPGRTDLVRILKSAVISVGKGQNRRVIDFQWGRDQERAFQRIKYHIARVKLTGGDPTIQYHLATDASGQGLGGVLFQIADVPVGTRASRETSSKEQTVMYMSYALTDPETRYHTTEKEALAVLKCLEECRWLVQGVEHPVILYTDHLALKTVFGSTSDATGRVARWLMRIQEYDLDIQHVKGSTQVVADGLSRLPTWRAPDTGDEDPFSLPALTLRMRPENSLELQWKAFPVLQEMDRGLFRRYEEDEWWGEVVDKLLRGDTDQVAKYHLVCLDGVGILMYHERRGQYARCVQKWELRNVLQELHDICGHFATRITLGRAVGKYFWPTRYEDIRAYCRSCHSCQLIGPNLPAERPHAIAISEPMQLFFIDYLGPFTPVSDNGFKYILIGGEYMSRYTIAMPTMEAKAITTWHFMCDHVASFLGWPAIIYSDNGDHFTGFQFAGQLGQFGVKHIPAPVRAPWSVGMAERLVKMMLNIMRAESAGDVQIIRKWDEFVGQAAQAINTRKSGVYGYSPAEILLGFNPHCFGQRHTENDLLRQALESDITERGDPVPQDLHQAMDIHSETLHATRAKIKKMLEQRHEKGQEEGNRRYFRVDDLVLLRRVMLDQIKGRKLEIRWDGPYRVARVLGGQRSVILNDVTTDLRIGKYHIDHLKLFVPRTENVQREAQELAEWTSHHRRFCQEALDRELARR